MLDALKWQQMVNEASMLSDIFALFSAVMTREVKRLTQSYKGEFFLVILGIAIQRQSNLAKLDH